MYSDTIKMSYNPTTMDPVPAGEPGYQHEPSSVEPDNYFVPSTREPDNYFVPSTGASLLGEEANSSTNKTLDTGGVSETLMRIFRSKARLQPFGSMSKLQLGHNSDEAGAGHIGKCPRKKACAMKTRRDNGG